MIVDGARKDETRWAVDFHPARSVTLRVLWSQLHLLLKTSQNISSGHLALHRVRNGLWLRFNYIKHFWLFPRVAFIYRSHVERSWRMITLWSNNSLHLCLWAKSSQKCRMFFIHIIITGRSTASRSRHQEVHSVRVCVSERYECLVELLQCILILGLKTALWRPLLPQRTLLSSPFIFILFLSFPFSSFFCSSGLYLSVEWFLIQENITTLRAKRPACLCKVPRALCSWSDARRSSSGCREEHWPAPGVKEGLISV